MRRSVDLLRSEPQSRLFFAAHAQSSLGTGAAYVALLLLAYERLRSPWAIALVLLADFLPAMLLGPVFGAAADRWSRRGCAVVADLMRGLAFVGLAVFDGFVPTVAFALLAGAGTGLFMPAVLAALPSLVPEPKLPAATSLFGAITDLGHTVGPAAAAGVLALASPQWVMVANAVTFMISALLLLRVPFGAKPLGEPAALRRGRALFREAGAGVAATAGMSGVRTLILAAAAVLLFAGLFNVAELLLVTEELDAGQAGFSAVVAVFGLGVVVGSLTGGRGGTLVDLKRRFLIGVLVVAAGFAAAGVAPNYAVVLAAFGVTGLGNGLVLVHERLLLQTTVSDTLMGRVFGVRDLIGSWCFAAAFIFAGVLLTLIGTRELLLLAGAGTLAVWAASAWALRDTWREATPASPALPPVIEAAVGPPSTRR